MILTSSTYYQPESVRSIMLKVLLALLPGIAVHAWFFGLAIIFQLCITTTAAIAAEALALKLRRRPLQPSLSDFSAIVTGWLVALSFPSIAPWWLTASGVFVAILGAKHLYGGLGQNPFNPAMVAYCVMIIAFPQLMSQWPSINTLDAASQFQLIFSGVRDVDAFTSATVLDTLRTGLRSGSGLSVADIQRQNPFGYAGGRGWELVALGYLIGGVYLLWNRIISWHMPLAFIAALACISGLFWLLDAARFAPPWFHLASGGAMLAAFFIITDPVSAATTPLGKIIFAAGVACIAYIVRVFGAYPEGIAFGVLLMNMCVPIIDMNTQPKAFGQQSGKSS